MKKLFSAYLIMAILFCFTSQAAVHIVNVEDFEFSPSNLTVNVGDTVMWMWDNSASTHTTTSTVVPSGAASWEHQISQSSPSFSYVVAVAGSYTYICSIHTSMVGHINATGTTAVETVVTQPSLSVNNNITDGALVVKYNLNKASAIDIQLWDVSGRTVKNLLSSFNAPGAYSENWLLNDMPNGIYFLVMKTSEGLVSRKIVLQ